MTFWRLIFRGLRYHARAHLGVVLGAAIGTAVLAGALVVGDSMRESLRRMALARLGQIHYALDSRNRLFAADLRARWTNAFPDSEAAPAASGLGLSGSASTPGGSNRVNRLTVFGVEASTWPALAGWTNTPRELMEPMLARWRMGEVVFVNEALAGRLGVRKGDTIILRVQKPADLALDAAVRSSDSGAAALRMEVGAVLSGSALGDFSLSSQGVPPANAFLPLEWLAEKVGARERANLLVFTSSKTPGEPRAGEDASELESRLRKVWRLEDAGLEVRSVPAGERATNGAAELVSRRVFLEPEVAEAAGRGLPGGVRTFTYLANLMRCGERFAPYSMVTAAEAPYVPAGMRDDEILLNEWLAEDLHAAAGDRVELSYYLVDSASRLAEHTNIFRVHGVTPMRGVYADRTLMPSFPGIAEAETTQDWSPGFPLEHKIRSQDEAYWKNWRGTPKAFVTLAAGQNMWSNRFGALTSIRFLNPGGKTAESWRQTAEVAIRAQLYPARLGMRIEPVRQEALQAASQGQDFGQLFLGFSFFLVVSALLLMGLLFRFGLESRGAEVGTLLALGFTGRQVRRLFLAEGALLALAGGAAGTALGLGYARAMLWGLVTLWRDAVGGARVEFCVTGLTLAIGFGAGVMLAVLVLWLGLRKMGRQTVHGLIAGGERMSEVVPSSALRFPRWVFRGGIAGAAALAAWAFLAGARANVESFFGAGSLMLCAGVAGVAIWLGRLLAADRVRGELTLRGLAARGCARRRGRSLATVTLLACGAFLIVSIGAFRLDAEWDAAKKSSGTGGFALMGESALPVVEDLNSASGWEFYGLSGEEMQGVKVAAFRVREGDEASCLNLNRARRPRLLGIEPGLLAGRFTLVEAAAGARREDGWALLQMPGEEIPAIGDANSIQWALGKKVGDTLDYTDELGRPFKVRLVGAVANSILQGSLVMDEARFLERYPGAGGRWFFLMDVPAGEAGRAAGRLTRALQDAGLELRGAARRLDELNAVQNTYLGTFQVLGGLGLLLGSAGLGLVVLRNVLERRSELALLAAAGFCPARIRGLVLREHTLLLGLGLGIGLAAAAVAALPVLAAPGTERSWLCLALTLAAVFFNGIGWTWAASRYALRGEILAALRNE
jgi:ABC-type lipoprotein release transport system permease subunit